MKRNLLSLTVAALLSCMPFAASARDTGRAVAAQFDSAVLNAPSKLAFAPRGPVSQTECQWQELKIPVRIGAKKVTGVTGDKVTPNYVPAVTFHVYLLIDAEHAVDKSGKPLDKKKRPIMLDKEITYVNIPLKKAQGVRVGESQVDAVANINLGVFLSPYDIHCIVDRDTADFEDPKGAKAQPGIKLLAVAVEAKYHDAACWYRDKAAKSDDIKVASDAKTWLPENWWKKTGIATRGARLMSINETPFASSYYPDYCATQPLYGSNGSSPVSAVSSSAPGADAPAADASDTSSEDASSTDTGTDASSDAADSDSSSGKSSERKSRRSRSSRY